MTSPAPAPAAPAARMSHYWFRQGTSRFAVRTSDLVGIATLSVVRPLPMTDPSLVGFGLYQGNILPVFDPVSLAGLTMDRASQPVRVAVVSVQGRPTLAFLCTEAGSTLNLSPSDLVPAAGRLSDAFCGEHQNEDLLVLDPVGLARSLKLMPGSVDGPAPVQQAS